MNGCFCRSYHPGKTHQQFLERRRELYLQNVERERERRRTHAREHPRPYQPSEQRKRTLANWHNANPQAVERHRKAAREQWRVVSSLATVRGSWTPEEDAQLYAGTAVEVALALGRTPASVKGRRVKLRAATR